MIAKLLSMSNIYCKDYLVIFLIKIILIKFIFIRQIKFINKFIVN